MRCPVHACSVGDPIAVVELLRASNLVHVVAGAAPLELHRGACGVEVIMCERVNFDTP